MNDALLKRRSAFEQLLGGILHRKQLWFHGPISREESERRIKTYGLKDGLFLVRERTQVNSFALCLAHRGEIFHYLLDMNTLGQLSIENGRKFENLLQVVDHYSRTPDGLLCSLYDMCPVSMFVEQGKANTQARVRHGPRRIDESEIIIQGELGTSVLMTDVETIWELHTLTLNVTVTPSVGRKRGIGGLQVHMLAYQCCVRRGFVAHLHFKS